MLTIVILALVAGFVALRLYSVLGNRTGAEQQPLPPKPVAEQPGPAASSPRTAVRPEAAPAPDMIDLPARDGLRAVVAADPSFDVGRFLEGAQSAYRMALEAFWKGDEQTLATLASDDVRAAFAAAIADREAAGLTLDNRLVTIESARIERAELHDRVAFITVRFDADVATVTRDADGNVVAGSLTDAVPTHDLWTFSRNTRSNDPNWTLVETDDVE